MTKPGRKQVRPIEQASITDKRFRRTAIASTRVSSRKVHPLMVLADLRKGSLASLTRYLAQESSIPDRAIAIELRKLISGSVCRSRYRLLVVEHPNRAKNKGGRPPSGQDEQALDRYRQMVASYEKTLPLAGRKAYRARELVAAEFECDDTTVKRAIRSVRQARKKAQQQVHRDEVDRQAASETSDHRSNALTRLRKSAKLRSG